MRTLDGKERIGSTRCYLDSAADCSIIGMNNMEKIGIKKQMMGPPGPEGVDAANKTPFKMIGDLKVTLEYFGRTVQDKIHVVEDDCNFLVSWDTCIELRILSRNYPAPGADRLAYNRSPEHNLEGGD